MWNEVGSVGVEKGEEEEEACRRERAKGARVVFCPMTGLRVLKTDLDMLVKMEKKTDVKKTEMCSDIETRRWIKRIGMKCITWIIT